jgi:hypothetical protein
VDFSHKNPLCKNITRLSGLAYDPEVYFNPEATAFSAEEIRHFHSATLKTAQKKKKQDASPTTTSRSSNPSWKAKRSGTNPATTTSM